MIPEDAYELAKKYTDKHGIIERKTVPINTSYLATGVIEYYEIGNLVVVEGTDIAFDAALSNTAESNLINLLNGTLPLPVANKVFLASYMSITPNNRISQRLRISPSGTLTPWWNSTEVTTTNTCFFTTIYRKA